MSAIDAATIAKLQRQIAHLTIDRTDITGEKLGSERAVLLEAIQKELGEFQKRLRPKYRPPR